MRHTLAEEEARLQLMEATANGTVNERLLERLAGKGPGGIHQGTDRRITFDAHAHVRDAAHGAP